MVRYLDAGENGKAGRIFDVCRQPPDWRVVGAPVISEETNDGIPTEWHFTQIAMTRNEYTLDFINTGSPTDYGIEDNDCVPTFGGAKHPGYALFNDDDWFATHAAEAALQDTYPGGPAGRTKRWVEGVGLVVAEGNSTRVATSDELKKELPFESCADERCSREMEALKRVVQDMREEAELASLPPTSPSEAPVESATSVVENDVLVTPAGQPESGSGRVLAQPRQTGGAYM
jgi:chitinase